MTVLRRCLICVVMLFSLGDTLWAGAAWHDDALLRRADGLAGEAQRSDRIRLLLNH